MAVSTDERRDVGGVRVVITGGGTGGHLTPMLALAGELDRRGVDVFLVGGTRGADRRLLSASGFRHRLVSAPTLERDRWWRNLRLPFALLRAVATGRRVVAERRPDVVVGTGGYVSVPVVLAGALAGLPIVLQEQNRTPGLATRFLVRWADRVYVQFPETAAMLGERAPAEVTGSPIFPPSPVAADFADRLDESRPTVGIFGGSQGARALNDALLEWLGTDPGSAPFNLIWQTGAREHERIDAAASWPERFVIRPFFDAMPAIYPRLDLIVCRAGAMTLAEITAWGIPSILVPYPHATDDHQTANARALEEAGGAIWLPQRDLGRRRLENLILGLLQDESRREAMGMAARALGRPDAAATVADRILELAEAA